MAFHSPLLPAARLPYSAGLLPFVDTHCPTFPETILTTATLARTRTVFCLLHGRFPDHVQTSQRAILDTDNRVAILYAPAAAGAGYTIDRLAGEARPSFMGHHRLSPGINCLGHLLTLLRHLLQ